MRNTITKSYDPRARGVIPQGLSGTDMAFRIAYHPEHETGVVPPGQTRRWKGLVDGLTLSVAAVQPWHRKARCAKPEFEGLDFFRTPAKARRVCALCPVRSECLDEALSFEATSRLAYGVRGGLAPEHRMHLIRRDESGTVYFGAGGGLVKIGTTRLDPQARAKVYDLRLLATEPGSYTRERELHKQFANDQVHGEWFRPSPALLDYIAQLPDPVRQGAAA